MTGIDRPEPIGGRLRDLRLRARLTQGELAGRSGLSVRAVRDLENGRVVRPRAGSLAALAAGLGLSEADLAARPALRIGLLGPFTATAGDRPVDIGPPAARTLLALLALHAGEFVSRDAVIDILWGEDPPRTSGTQVQATVARLRRALAPYGLSLRTARHGYQLRLDGCQLDAAAFVALADQAARSDDAIEIYARALRAWRGPVLADAHPRLRAHPAAVALTRRRVTVAMAYADRLATSAEPHDGLEPVDVLRELAADEPLHEPLHARLILALARSGDRAGAARVYEEMFGRLTQELGIDCGAELRDAHRRATAAEAEPWVRPAQLPAPAAGFVGRADLLARMDAAGAGLCVVTGSAGVGKTTLAVRWAHAARPRFPDGQLFVDLHGFDPAVPPARPASVLRGFLAALGVPPERVPAEFDARVGLYRSLLADRRVLVVLDNARDAEQVRPLLPGVPGGRTVVTSRDQLRGLVTAEGAEPVTVDLLSPDEARDLLIRRIGIDRVTAAPAAAAEITTRCARLPLALSVVAARAALYPGFPLTAVAAELRATPDDSDVLGEVHAAFSWSCRTLGDDAARLFRLCAAHPGHGLAAPAAASLCGWAPARARAALAELVRANLLTEGPPGRYGQHDLLRAYAGELLADDEREPARRRVLDHYRSTALSAAALIEPHREPIVVEPPVDGVVPVALRDREQAVAWFTAEHEVLMATIRHAAEAGLDAAAWQLAWAMLDYLDHQGHWRDWIEVELVALAAAARRGDEPGQAHAHRILGRGYAQLAAYDDAARHYESALALYDRLGDALGSAHTSMSRAWMDDLRGDFDTAQQNRWAALALYRQAGHRVGEARTLNAIGYGYALLGAYPQALDLCREALALNETVGDAYGRAAIWDSIGYIHHHLGDQAEAMRCLRIALAAFRDAGDLFNQADVQNHLGDAYVAAGEVEAAREAWTAAAEILDDLGHPGAAAIREKLAG